MTPANRKEMAALLSEIVEARGTDAGMERLNALLSSDESARAYYLHYVAIHAELERRAGRPQSGIIPSPPSASSRHWWRTSILAAAACAMIGLGLGIGFGHYRQSGGAVEVQAPPPIVSETRDKVLAVVANTEGAVWDSPEADPALGSRLRPGKFRLEKGRVLLEFNAGERVTVEGPAVFELLDVNRLSLKSGSLVATITPQGKGFTVILPNGALVDLGTEFAVSVGNDGRNRVKVLQGSVMASSTNRQGNTTWEETLVGGDEFAIVSDTPLVREAGSTAYPEHLPAAIEPLEIDSAYNDAVMGSVPLGYWRFDAVDALERVNDETGRVPLILRGDAVVEASARGGNLIPNPRGRAGCAVSEHAYPGLNTPRGCSMEFWAFSDSVDWQTLGGLVLDGPRPEGLQPEHARHSPHLLTLERAGASGSKVFHLHPDFAMRALFRSPAGYLGGVNAYTNAPYLIHRWHHVVVTRGDERLRIYVDGALSGESDIPDASDHEHYRLLIGRLHLQVDDGDTRPWSGAVDEVALYDRTLQADEIRRHFEASGRSTRSE